MVKSSILILLLFFVQAAATQNVGVGTTSPVEKLDVAGNIKADTLKPAAIKLLLNAGTGKVLVSDVAGNANWQNINSVISGDYQSSFDYYVSSVNGNDNNSGFSSATPKKTIASLSSFLTTGKSIGIEKGSHFREMLKIDAPNIVIGTYGSGSKPVLDATDVIPSSAISTVGGYTNLYQFAIAPVTTGGQSFSFFESGRRLKRVSSQADCAATEGSFFAPPPVNGTAALIYFHPIGHTNATADGKKYEVTTRDAGLMATAIATGLVVDGIHTRGSLQNDGTAVVNGTGSYIKNCLFEDGSKHTMFVTDNCIVEDCTALKGEGIDSYFVYFYTDGSSSTGTTFRRCNAIGDYAYGEEQTKYATTIGFFCHASAGTLNAVTYEDCYAENFIGGFGGDALTINLIKCKTHFVAVAGSSFASSPQTVVNIRQCFFDQRSPHDYQKAYNETRPLLQLSTGTNNIEGNVLVVDPIQYGNIIYSNQDNTVINLRKNTVVAQSGAAFFCGLLKNGTGQVISTGNIFYGFTNVYDSNSSNAAVIADGNAYFRINGNLNFKNGINTYATYQDWQASGQDAGGINVNPNFINNIANWTKAGNAGISNTAIQAIQAGATFY